MENTSGNLKLIKFSRFISILWIVGYSIGPVYYYINHNSVLFENIYHLSAYLTFIFGPPSLLWFFVWYKINKDTKRPITYFLKNLKDGNFGLAKTYWLFTLSAIIVVSIYLNGILWFTNSTYSIFIVFYLVFLFYLYHALVGLWNSSSNYSGWLIWSILGKIAMVLTTLSAVSKTLRVFQLLS